MGFLFDESGVFLYHELICVKMSHEKQKLKFILWLFTFALHQ